ncbi:MAG TPA: serine/threonine protein kinase [Deltaproteobacteria bacterium]|nr:serine/threonine protein kinase [Deltaproteobacteria bacterium]
MSLYVDELFDEISRLPPESREHALSTRCAGFPSVEAQLRALLSADEAPAQDPPVVLQPGVVLGTYELVEAIGVGATASVWRAWDRHLEVSTALKLLNPTGHMQGNNAQSAVLNEARAASSIISDHVVRIRAAGRFADGHHYIDMELCAEHRPGDDGSEVLEIGRSLSEVQLHGIEEKVRVIAEAARGVDAAHRVGVLHRDLKPGNILLTPVSRRAKVTDFGLAAEQIYPMPDATTSCDQTITVLLEARDGKVVGTPAYMPPEQAFGHPPTRATDVYALGATLYALLVGEHPYEPRLGAPVPALDVLAQVRQRPPRPLRRAARVPRRLERIVERAMARSARDRYPTASALADDLEAWLAGLPTQVDGRAPVLRSVLFVGRHRTVATTIAALWVVLILFSGALGWLELQHLGLERAIAEERSELVIIQQEADQARDALQRAEARRESAVAEAEEAQRRMTKAEQGKDREAQSRRQAELAQADAEAARADAEAAQRRAEAAQADAEAARADAERGMLLAEDARDQASEALSVAQGALARAREELATSKRAFTEIKAELEARLEREQIARAEVEAALRGSRSAIQEAEQLIDDLTRTLVAEQAARKRAEQDLDALSRVVTISHGPPEPGELVEISHNDAH